jgi:CRISPR/Cas system-associated protein Cas10 (large subunit of type III CRISPR-Cas system)
MKMKSHFQERLEYHIALRKAQSEPVPFAGHLCELCGKPLEIDEIHKCREKSLAELANEFEDWYNARMGRSGVRWAGD